MIFWFLSFPITQLHVSHFSPSFTYPLLCLVNPSFILPFHFKVSFNSLPSLIFFFFGGRGSSKKVFFFPTNYSPYILLHDSLLCLRPLLSILVVSHTSPTIPNIAIPINFLYSSSPSFTPSSLTLSHLNLFLSILSRVLHFTQLAPFSYLQFCFPSKSSSIISQSLYLSKYQ